MRYQCRRVWSSLAILLLSGKMRIALVLASSTKETTTQTQSLPTTSITTTPTTTTSSSTTSFIMGESALMDKETGRIFWESDISNTLTAAVGPKLRALLKIHHLKSTILSLILLGAGIRALTVRFLSTTTTTTTSAATTTTRTVATSTLILVLQWTILQLPQWDHWFLAIITVLYFVESYFCSTRRYLTNYITSSEELEQYLEQLREISPRVEWKVRSFHYEVISPLLASWIETWQTKNGIMSQVDNGNDKNRIDLSDIASQSVPTTASTTTEIPSWLQRKKVTNFVMGTYHYEHCVDKTLAGVWKRAKGYYKDTNLAAPMSKITLSKLLVLADSKTRMNYFQQQAAFVAEHCTSDSMAEFSTNIVIPGFKPRLLARRQSSQNDKSHRVVNIAFHFMSLPWFWCFTMLGLSAPYRFWFDDQCDEIRVSVVKEASMEPPKLPSQSKMPSAWFWSRETPETDNNNYQSNQFRMLMEELKLYGGQPVPSSIVIEQQDEELRKNELQDVMESVESASLMAEQERTPHAEE